MEQIEARPQAAVYKHSGNADDPAYDAWIATVQERFVSNIEGGKAPLFTTSISGRQPEGTKDLFEIYLEAFPAELRQYHNCSCCRHFVRTYGALVVIGDDGTFRSALWAEEDAPEAYKAPIAAVLRAVRRASVTGVFVNSDATWGSPVTGVWHHLALRPPTEIVHKSRAATAFQASAEKLEDRKNVARALGEYTPEHVDQVVTLLKSEQLYRSEKVLGPAEWLQKLHKARAAAKGKEARENVLWLAVAKAPAGFCHPRTSMVGTLLDDIAAGKSFEAASAAFKAKMHPLQYQRPQAAPSSGAIKAAEALFESMGLAAALKRRFARLDDVQALWTPGPPKADEKPAGGIFGHLTPKGAASQTTSMRIPATAMTWEKFARTVLAEAVAIECLAPAHGNFAALATAIDPEAPPLLQWDREERRNPVSWYLYHGGSPASRWSLTGGAWTKVNAICLQPNQWHDAFKHQGEGVVFVLDGAKERESGSLALFPATLRSELHGVRSVIEAHSRSSKLEGAAEASACGLIMQRSSGSHTPVGLRVTDKAGAMLEYKIDRLD